MKRLIIWMPALAILVVAMFAAASADQRIGVVEAIAAPELQITPQIWNIAHN